MIEIDKTAPRPIYLQVKEGLKHRIAEGLFDPQEPLPSEHDLARTLGLNRLTVRRALVELADEGLIHRVRGRGSFLCQPQHDDTSSSTHPTTRGTTVALLCDTERLDPQDALFYYRIFQGVLRADPDVTTVYRRYTGNPRAFAASLAGDSEIRAFIVLSLLDQKLFKLLMKTGRPIVFLDCAPIIRPCNADSLSYETEESSYRAVTSLLRLGHRDIGMLVQASLPPAEHARGKLIPLYKCRVGVNPVAGQRLNGYRRAFHEHGLSTPEDLIFPVIPWAESAYAATRQILRSRRVPTALFTTTDSIAVGVVSAVKDHGWRVPDDVSVIGVGDLGHFCTPALSTIRMPLESVGETAVRLLKERLADPSLAPRTIGIPTEYIARSTCGVPREGGAG